MLERLKEYRFIKKSKSEIESDKIVDNLTIKMWNECGYLTAYYLGGINQLKILAECLKTYDRISKDDILGLIKTYKDTDAPDEIKNLANIILDEFDYKEKD